jgi:drug/metabolite transporter (DMT)-like permease
MGALYMVGSAFFFSLMSLLVKTAGQRIPSQEIVFARSVVGLLLSYWLVRRAGLSPWGNNRRLLALRGLFGFLAMSCYFFALTRLPIAEATVIQFTSPLWTALLAVVVLSERAGRVLILSTISSLAGVVLVTKPAVLFGSAASELDLLGVGVALLGAFISAAAFVTVRQASKTDDPLVIVFFFALIATPAGAATAAPVFTWPHTWEWLVLLGVGVVTQVAQVCLTRGLKLETAGRATSIGYTQIVFASVWGVAFFSELPDVWAGAGALFIVAGTLAVAVSRPAGS